MKKSFYLLALIPLILAAVVMHNEPVRSADPSLYEADLSSTETSLGVTASSGFCSLDGDFNLSVYFNTTGLDQEVQLQRLYRGGGEPPTNDDWRTVVTYTANTETCDTAVNGRYYYYRFKYTGDNGGAHVRLDK